MKKSKLKQKLKKFINSPGLFVNDSPLGDFIQIQTPQIQAEEQRNFSELQLLRQKAQNLQKQNESLAKQLNNEQQKHDALAQKLKAQSSAPTLFPCLGSPISNYLHASKNPDALISDLRGSLADDISKQTLDTFMERLRTITLAGYDYRQFVSLDIRGICNMSKMQYEVDAARLSADKKKNHCAYGFHMLPPDLQQLLLERSKGKDAIDGGAYDGQTAVMLVEDYGARSAHAFEPVSYELLNKEMKSREDIVCVNSGLYSEDRKDVSFTYFDDVLVGATMVFNKKNTAKGHVTKLDTYAEAHGLDIGCVKLDVEGVEYHAIAGMKEIIKKNKPLLLISVYHTGEDLFEIVPMLKELRSDYKFYMRHILPYSESIDFLRCEYLIYAV